MPNQQLPPSTPIGEGCTIAYQVMDAAVTYHLENGGPNVARQHLEVLSNELFLIYPLDTVEARNAIMARICAVEKAKEQEAELRRQQNQCDVVMAIMSAMAKKEQPPMQESPTAPEPQSVLPPKLATDRAMLVWSRLQQEGLVDENYQPVRLSRAEMAFLAYDVAVILGIEYCKWRLFEELWDKNGLKSDYFRSMNMTKTYNLRCRLKELFADIK